MSGSALRLTIEERIQALPQELQDQILESTLIAGVKLREVVAITESYKPPWQLHVNRITRKAVVEVYYGATIFQVNLSETQSGTSLQNCIGTAKAWLLSLPKDKRSRIPHFRVYRHSQAISTDVRALNRLSLSIAKVFFQLCYDLPLEPRCIELDFTLQDKDGSTSTSWVNWDGAHALLETRE